MKRIFAHQIYCRNLIKGDQKMQDIE